MRWFFAGVSALCLIAAGLWGRAALLRYRFLRSVEQETTDPDARTLASSNLSHVAHAAGVYLAIAVAAAVGAVTHDERAALLLGLLVVPIVSTIWLSRYARRDARLSFLRLGLEQRAHEVLSQEDSATQRWAERLAPSRFPDTTGYEVGTAHQAGTGVMSGDLLDVFRLPSGRLCCVVGDVSGHDVEASISALQTKFLLRTYLRRYRDPGQALEELNGQLIDHERPEEFVSIFVAIFDTEAGTLRYASAGHPVGWLCVDRSPRALPATGPLLMMDAGSRYRSVEMPYQVGDLLVLSTDGLLEARAGDQFFGEERVAGVVRREFETATGVLCKTLIDEAVDFSAGPLGDDVTVLAVRRR
ncbi:MAG: serine/threonine-protein phosphatase [Microthrixaceae bacterium]|nr:serine/threonine-protein phosphatase [Microthrixaceae bacterium]